MEMNESITYTNTSNSSNRNKRRQERKKKLRNRIRILLGIITMALLLVVGVFSFGQLQKVIEYAKIGSVGDSSNNVQYSFAKEKASGTKVGTENNIENDTEALFTKNIKEQDNWNLRLVNPWNMVPDNYKVSLVTLKNGHAVDERIFPELQEMMDACREDGLSPLICSGYRTNEKQTSLFEKQVQKYMERGYTGEEAKKEAARWVAVPGTSEHQLGLAVDIVSTDHQVLDDSQSSTEVQKWLMKNCYKYGFILRYPEDKSDITGIGFEPWHYRYVGKEVAKEIMKKGICLEEYLENKKLI